MKRLVYFLLPFFFATSLSAVGQGSGKNLDFNGSTTYVTCGSMNLSGSALTLMCWFKVDNFKSGHPFITSLVGIETTGNSAFIRIGDAGIANNEIQFVLWLGSNQFRLNGSTNLQTGRWYHIAAVYDGSNMTMYLDGQQEATTSRTGTISGSGTFNIGYNYALSRIIDGEIDEVSVWKAALSQSTIQNWMCQSIKPSHPDYGNLEAYYPLDETSGTTTTDESGNGHTGTLIGSPPRNNSVLPIGDTCVSDWSSPSSLSIQHPDGDEFTLSNISGSPTAAFVYRIDTLPNLYSSIPSGINYFDSSRHYGIYFMGGTNPTGTVSYDFASNSFFTSNPACILDYLKRDGNADNSWTSIAPSITSSVMTKTSQGDGQFMMAFNNDNRIHSQNSKTICIGNAMTLRHGSTGLNYTWMFNGGVVPNNMTNTLFARDSGEYKLIFSNAYCSDTSDPFNLYLNPLPVVTANYQGSYCEDEGIVNLTDGNPAGGSYTGLHVTDSTFNVQSSGIGRHQMVYLYVDSNGCSDTAWAHLDVLSNPNVTLTPFSPRCADAAPFVLTGASPAGGTWTYRGQVITSFTPDPNDPGLHSIKYSYTDTSGCSDVDSIYVRLHALPEIDFSLSDTLVCDYANAFAVTATPSGGTYGGTGLSGGQFDPGVAGAGNHIVTYAYTDSTHNCSNSDTLNITVEARPATPTISQIVDTLYSSSSTGNSWRDDQGNEVGTGASLVPASNGDYYLVVTSANGCISLSSDTIAFEKNTTSIAEPGVGGFEVFPNPSNGTLHITGLKAALSVFSSDGRLVASMEAGQQTIVLSAGLYILKSGEEVKKLLVTGN